MSADDRISFGKDFVGILNAIAVVNGHTPPPNSSIMLEPLDVAAWHAAERGCDCVFGNDPNISAALAVLETNGLYELLVRPEPTRSVFDGHSLNLDNMRRGEADYRGRRRRAVDEITNLAGIIENKPSKGRKLLVALGVSLEINEIFTDPARQPNMPTDIDQNLVSHLSRAAQMITDQAA